MELSESNKAALKQRGISESDLTHQLELIARGTNFIKLLRPCSVGDGIIRMSNTKLNDAIAAFDAESANYDLAKFVPASGAATRMFKRIYTWVNEPKKNEADINRFFRDIEKFPLFEEWVLCADRCDIETFESGLDSKIAWLKLLLEEEGLGYALKPKGLIPFHLYGETTRTPLVEHLVEATRYASQDNVCKLHFTISEQHLDGFEAELEIAKELGELKSYDFQVSFSFQEAKTDTVAANVSNEPFTLNGDLVMRPGGHGALIHNLNNLDSDLVFVKNIDNVCHQERIETTVRYKKALAGKLFELRADLHLLDKHLKKGLIDEREIQKLRDKWQIRIPKSYRVLQAFLKRPIRVCGMVLNEGEPGGGPFWVKDQILGESIQILEQSQIDLSDSSQSLTLKHASHFNPVDIVCCLKDLEGNKIDLLQYIDSEQFFIAQKTVEGQSIKALEWPGLWNGAMANWITLFVEVPVSTFNPVKEFKDLLRPAHSAKK